ncbi:MAG: orotate phosphoribosyltransferase [Chloroflexota bacterium]|nr:orotate phosphoribosyltransferase [Chloroflexota bacterium]
MTDIEKLYKRVYELEVFKKGSFTLSSGKKSNYYIDGRLISLDPSGSEKISKIFINKINFKIDKIGGPATAAIPLISSLSSYLKHIHNKEVPGFYIRPSSKEHGLTNKIEGSLNKEENVVVIDDTLTTGGSIINTIKEIQSVGANVKLSLSIFDRNEGGKEKIEKLGINHYSIFRYDKEKEDLVF